MEKIVVHRLLRFFEQDNIILSQQCCFRKHLNIVKHLIDLKDEILEAFDRKCSVVSMFFDIEKAYDTAWKYDILKKLIKYRIKENLSYLI